MHAAHRRAHHQAQVIDAQPPRQQRVLRLDHVGVAVVRKVRVHSVARLARVAVSDAVRQNDVVLRRVEQLAWAEQHAREIPTGERAARSRGAVQHHHRVPNDSRGVAPRLAHRDVVESQLGKRFAVGEFEVVNDVVMAGKALRVHRERQHEQAEEGGEGQSSHEPKPQESGRATRILAHPPLE
jgi:hypothetical protein